MVAIKTVLAVLLFLCEIPLRSQDNLSCTLIGRWGDGSCYSVATDNDTVYFANGCNLEIVDFTNPEAPVKLGKSILPHLIEGITLSGKYAYVSDGDYGLRIIDISNPSAPFEAAFVESKDFSYNVAVAGNYAYLADDFAGLRIIDISDPVSPSEVSVYKTVNGALGVQVSGNYAYVAARDSGLRIIDISNPGMPFEAGYYVTEGHAFKVTLSGNYAYVSAGNGGLRILDISNPASLSEIGSFKDAGYCYDIAIAGHHAFQAARYGGICVLDISNPALPVKIDILDTQRAKELALYGNHLYVADTYGMTVFDISDPASLKNVAVIETRDEALGITVSGKYAYIANRNTGVAVIDITIPSTPVTVSKFLTWSNSVVVSENTAMLPRTKSLLLLISPIRYNRSYWAVSDFRILLQILLLRIIMHTWRIQIPVCT